MHKVATPDKPSDASRAPGRLFSTAMALSVLFLAALWLVLCRQLSGEWSVNQQYNFGWFVPFFASYLFWLRWQDAPPAEISNLKSRVSTPATLAIAIAALLLLLPVRLFEIANPEWRPLDWAHAAAVVTLTLLMVWYAGGRRWLRHFAFPVAFTLIAVPWPTTVETPVIQGLMRVVARAATETAMLLGTPAQVEGNLIRVTNGLVGVNEACSGIRSLQTSLMIGLLFGELKRFSVSRRVALVAGAVAIALFANLLRAIFLVQVAATKDISEVSRWHDIAGYTIIAVVFVGTMALAYLLGKSDVSRQKSDTREQRAQSAIRNEFTRRGEQTAITSSWLIAALCWLLLIEVGTAAWYRVHERNLVSGIPWSVQWPEQAPNFRKLKIDEEIRSVLRFDEGHGAAWTITSPAEHIRQPDSSPIAVNPSGPNTISFYLYVFRWKPGRNSALLANLHRPDVCLPASGWRQVADEGVRTYPVSDGFDLPFRHFEFQRTFENSAPQTAHGFFCLSEDWAAGSPERPQAANGPTNSPGMSGSASEWTRTERVRAVLEGRRHLGQQIIQSILISSDPLPAAEAESHLRDLVRDIIVLREPEKSL